MSITNGIMHKFYKHKISGKLYDVMGVGRLVDKPDKLVVVYRQMYDSTLYHSKPIIPLPIGSIWVRDIFDFNEKMEPYTKE